MATLTGNQIDLSYQGLIKTTDNAALGAVEKEITDGVGTASTLKLGTTSASFVGTLDLTGATVLGGGGAAGLVAGTGVNSMKSADDLTTSDAIAGGQNAIALGEGAIANQDYGLTIGTFAQSGIFSTVVGTYAEGSGLYCSAFGPSSKATADGATSVGQLTEATGAGSVAVGREAKATAADAISIGDQSVCSNVNGVAIGFNASATAGSGSGSVAIGWNARTVRDAGVAIGRNLNQLIGVNDHYRPIAIGSGTNVRGGDVIGIGTDINILGANTNNKIAIGTGAVCNDFEGAVALGAGVTAIRANTVAVKEIETVVAGGGIIFTSPDGTKWKQSISNTGVPVYTLA
tara:strand:- start:8713 stop:9750 length:1038 start_codon:yes stop_codon:yes gene_type:complete